MIGLYYLKAVKLLRIWDNAHEKHVINKIHKKTLKIAKIRMKWDTEC